MPANSATGTEFFRVDPERSALIVIDMQNAFVAEGAPFEIPAARAMIPCLERIVTAFRERERPIIWTQSDHRPPYGGLMLRKFPVIRESRVLWDGELSFEMYADMLQPIEGRTEYRIIKHKFD